VAFALEWNLLSDEQKRFQAAKMEIHAAMVDRIDREIGRVLNQISSMGALDDTLVLFFSDNGASAEILVRGDGNTSGATAGSAGSFLCLGPGWSTACNTPFRRHKIWVHEGGISTPLIAHWPNGITGNGQLRHQVGHVVDIAPTLLELIGAPSGNSSSGAPPFPGKSLVSAFGGDSTLEANKRPLYFSHEGNRALRVGNWKLLSARIDGDMWSLYDLSRDRSEMTDLATREPERVRLMAAQWEALDGEFRRQAGGTNPGKERVK
jgi:arylsulfatase